MTYHTKAQNFIKDSKSKGYPVKAEDGELIAYPKGTEKNTKKDVLGALKRKAIDVTSDVLSAPKRMREDKKAEKFNAEADNYKYVRERKGMEDKGDYSDPLFRARVTAINDAFDREHARQGQIGALQKSGGEDTAKAAPKGKK